MITEIDIDLLTSVEMLKLESCSHNITKKYLSSSEDIWYCKEAINDARAKYEVLGQEFCRLLSPFHPMMRLAKNSTSNQFFVLSKEIPDFQPIPLQKQTRFNHGIYTGLGQILIMSIFLHEIDLNVGNLGLDRHNRLIKIDGDWSFASFVNPDLFVDKATGITPELLDRLPYLIHYDAHNWLDILQKGTTNISSELFSDELINTPHFRHEINSAILQIILLPDNYIHQFIALYLPENIQDLTIYLIQRKIQLMHSAMQNISFTQFITTKNASEIAREFLQNIKNFVTADGLSPLHSEEYTKFEFEYLSYWSNFREKLSKSPQTVADVEKINNGDLLDENMDADIESDTTMSSYFVENNFRMFSVTSARNDNSPIRFNRTFSNLSDMF